MSVRLLIIALVLFWLVGCASMAPEYTRPEAPVPDEWPTGPAYQADIAEADRPLAGFFRRFAAASADLFES